jgi:hypothetical protein
MCPIQSLPIDIVRCIFYDYLISSPYSELTKPLHPVENKFPLGLTELRNFLSCNRRVCSDWSRDLIYFNLSKKWTVLFVQDFTFRDRVIALVKDPTRQIGLNVSGPVMCDAVTDEMIRKNCNHVHCIYFPPFLINSRVYLIDNVNILHFAGDCQIPDLSSFNNTVELSVSAVFKFPEIYPDALQKVRYLFIDFAPNITRIPALPQLERLQLKHVENLQEIDILGCPNLKEVSLSQ